jgi:hypothetical protein
MVKTQAGFEAPFADVPRELKTLPQWVLHINKAPFNPKTGRHASANRPETWSSFETALKALETGSPRPVISKAREDLHKEYEANGYSGIGFELNHNGLVGFDIDHCVDPKTGKLSTLAQEIVDMLDSYTEYSPSGLGLRIFVFGDMPADGRKDSENGLEIYKASRYLTITGQTYKTAKPIKSRTNEVLALYNRFFDEEQTDLEKLSSDKSANSTEPSFEDDDASWLYDDIISRACEAGNGPLFKKLFFEGVWSDLGYPSQSEADLALCNILAYWTGGDRTQMDGLFQKSALMRDKWHAKHGEKTIGERTIDKALKKMRGKTFAPRPGSLKIISAQELQEKDIPPIRWIVKNLIPQGLTLIVAPPKSGKSWLMLDLCLSVAAGKTFLGNETVKTSCLYLALEDGERRLKARMQRLLPFDEQAPSGFDYILDICSLNQGFQEQIEEYIQAHKDVGLIIVDTVQRIRASSNSKNAYAQDYAEFSTLKKLADKHNIALILVHHTKKGNDETDPFMRISGTNGIMGSADTILMLERKNRADSQAALHITGRDVESPALALEFNKDLCRWAVLGNAEQFEEQKRKEVYEGDSLVITIKGLLEGTGFWQGTVQEIHEAGFFHEDPRTIGKRLTNIASLLSQHDGITHLFKRSNGKNIHSFEYDLLK